MTLWHTILLAAIVCVALKTAGYLVPPAWFEAPRPSRTIDLLTVALLSALVVVQTLGVGGLAAVVAYLVARWVGGA